MHASSRTLIAATVIGLIGALAAHAQSAADAGPLPAGVFLDGMQPYRESYIAYLLMPFRAGSGPDQRLTADDIARAEQREQARRRAGLLTPFFERDLDGDGKVTPAEIADAPVTMSRREPLTAMDGDHDGTVTLDEALVYAGVRAALPDAGRTTSRLSQLLALDPNKDGTLTADELETLGRSAFAYFDRDGDGVLSEQEMAVREKAMNERQVKIALERRAALCNLPKAGQTDRVLFVGAYEAAALSDVTVSGQDAVTGTAELAIDAGDTPLYIVVSSYGSIIWRLTGHTERVARLVVASDRKGGGATGLQTEKVTIVSQPRCLPYASSQGAGLQHVMTTLGAFTGKPVDDVLASYTLPKANLPSNAVPAAEWKPTRNPAPLKPIPLNMGQLRNVDPATYQSFIRFNPAGLVSIDPAAVVSQGVAERYQVLPQEAGLLQLLMDGSLEANGSRGYLVRKPIPRFPAGLAGAHRVNFVLAKGVPRPAGNPGHSSVRVEGEAVLKPGDVPAIDLPIK
ncbi:hypothetical protein QTL95_12855 [Rhizobium sp. S152]|uniref:hypothetical protein n=1 Tax=Rhizobium sp. S152 TaxID=3055038 RepID=UPI0025AA1D8C|nr:hypothetical protein [Rhizobium sp. S152]MDM9626792.1 hypothetical protein [Rhizobium sp. S152]